MNTLTKHAGPFHEVVSTHAPFRVTRGGLEDLTLAPKPGRRPVCFRHDGPTTKDLAFFQQIADLKSKGRSIRRSLAAWSDLAGIACSLSEKIRRLTS